jgi:hypothetical protein
MDAGRCLCGGSDDLYRFQSDMERNGSIKDCDMQFRRKDEKQVDCLVSVTAWRNKNGLRGYLFVVRDVTAQKKTEHSLRSLLRMGDRLNSASVGCIWPSWTSIQHDGGSRSMFATSARRLYLRARFSRLARSESARSSSCAELRSVGIAYVLPGSVASVVSFKATSGISHTSRNAAIPMQPAAKNTG